MSDLPELIGLYTKLRDWILAEIKAAQPFVRDGKVDLSNPNFVGNLPPERLPAAATTIRGATDYDDTTVPTDGQAVVWDGASSKFHPATVSGGSTSVTVSGGLVLDPTITDGDLIYRHAHSTMTVPVGFIGDSITYGYGTTTPAPTLAAGDLTGSGLTVTQYNQGHNGAKASDWIPGAASGYLATAKTAFAAAGVRVVHIMLGTNDAGASVSAATYQANMVLLLADLVSSGYIPVVSYSPGTNQPAVNTLLAAYQPMLDALINGVTVLRGDTQAYQYFITNNSQTIDGVHPNDTSTPVLAQYWADVLAAPAHALSSQLALDRIPIGAAGQYLRVNVGANGYEFGTPVVSSTETFGVVFTGSGDVALRGDGSIATKRN